MGTTQPSTRALPAYHVLERFEQLFDLPCYNAGHFTLSITTGIGTLRWTIQYQNKQPQDPVALKQARSLLQKHTSITCESCQISNANGAPERRVTYRCNDGLIAHFDFGQFDDPLMTSEVCGRLEQLFDVSMFVDVATQGAAEAQLASLQVRERAAADLASAQQKLESALVEMSTKDAERWRTREAELLSDFRQRVDRLEAEIEQKRSASEQQLQAEREKLQRERHEHEKRAKDLDAREHRAARRSTHTKLDQLLADANELKLLPQTEHSRTRTERSIWAMIIATAMLTLLSGTFVFFVDSTLVWTHAVPFATSTFATWATLSYYIRWNDRWTRERAEAQAAMRRYRADAIRANWLAELVSEAVEQEHASPLPTELISALTRNLFSDPATPTEALHPLERLVDQAKELEVGKDKIRLASGK